MPAPAPSPLTAVLGHLARSPALDVPCWRGKFRNSRRRSEVPQVEVDLKTSGLAAGTVVAAPGPDRTAGLSRRLHMDKDGIELDVVPGDRAVVSP